MLPVWLEAKQWKSGKETASGECQYGMFGRNTSFVCLMRGEGKIGVREDGEMGMEKRLG